MDFFQAIVMGIVSFFTGIINFFTLLNPFNPDNIWF